MCNCTLRTSTSICLRGYAVAAPEAPPDLIITYSVSMEIGSTLLRGKDVSPSLRVLSCHMEYDGWQTGTGICAFGVKSAARE